MTGFGRCIPGFKNMTSFFGGSNSLDFRGLVFSHHSLPGFIYLRMCRWPNNASLVWGSQGCCQVAPRLKRWSVWVAWDKVLSHTIHGTNGIFTYIFGWFVLVNVGKHKHIPFVLWMVWVHLIHFNKIAPQPEWFLALKSLRLTFW